MTNGVGRTLQAARRRRKIDLSEVEAATRIRPRFLRAIEDEEWDALPGGVYTRGFIRTYASFLGLDGERLAGDYRREVEGESVPGPELAPVAASTATGSPGGRRARPRPAWLVVPAVILLAALVIVMLPERGDEGGGVTRHPAPATDAEAAGKDGGAAAPVAASGVSLRVAASAEVWVCLLNAKGRPLIEGQILEAGAEEGPFRSGSFTVSFGNGEISMLIDGDEAEIPATSSPIGYSIGPSGALTELSEAERPTCT